MNKKIYKKVLFRNCIICNKKFKPKDNSHIGKFCSKTCYWKDMSKRKGKGTSAWKEKISYSGIHKWIARELGTPNYCEFCERDDLSKYDWANISGLYFRDINDWMRLCRFCHSKWDRLIQKKWLTQNNKKKHDINAFDFDGTICKTSGENFIDDSPSSYAKEIIEIILSNGHYCYVLTSREREDWRLIAKWMHKNNIPGMHIHNLKLKGITRIIDDRAIRFTNWQDIRKYFV